MKIRALLMVLSSLASPLALAVGTVDVYTAGDSTPKKLSNAERLIDLVGQPRLANSWWPGAVVSERQATIAQQARHQALLARLSALAADESGNSAAAINALRQQLQAVKVTGRQIVELDPDYLRTHRLANRPLQGEYTLWVGPQPTSITIVGLVSSPGKKPFTPERDVVSYLDDQSLLSGAERSYAWVIYPNGKTQKVPVGYWNRRHVEPMPGSVIFVGFAPGLWSNEYDELNADILQSLSHRIPE
ncbi:capsule biosynthesis GfcC D2 domain-containing protein [Kosakonia sp. BYX6]|uniref:Capsule biosynthesis GfcC D2 domain-containing protein n=1 Tax=Kosakonia calanthes TaxID=3139408 RepID=A0ABZ3B498_9ENTR